MGSLQAGDPGHGDLLALAKPVLDLDESIVCPAGPDGAALEGPIGPTNKQVGLHALAHDRVLGDGERRWAFGHNHR